MTGSGFCSRIARAGLTTTICTRFPLTGQLKQLTDGPFDDIEPTYLPDGGIIFCSSRCNRFVPCWYTQVAILYRCEADGSNLRPLSSNIENDNTPWVLGDGRILYTRWEYVDRSREDFHHLWVMNPDGTGQMVFYGNSLPGDVYLDAKPIPGTRQGGHGQFASARAPRARGPDRRAGHQAGPECAGGSADRPSRHELP
jgi:hypothetical protein